MTTLQEAREALMMSSVFGRTFDDGLMLSKEQAGTLRAFLSDPYAGVVEVLDGLRKDIREGEYPAYGVEAVSALIKAMRRIRSLADERETDEPEDDMTPKEKALKELAVLTHVDLRPGLERAVEILIEIEGDASHITTSEQSGWLWACQVAIKRLRSELEPERIVNGTWSGQELSPRNMLIAFMTDQFGDENRMVSYIEKQVDGFLRDIDNQTEGGDE